MDLSRSKGELGYEPTYDLPDAVRDYAEWYRSRNP
jgi:nucleoside-diphosphate-sugar epimerase